MILYGETQIYWINQLVDAIVLVDQMFLKLRTDLDIMGSFNLSLNLGLNQRGADRNH